MFKFTRKPKSDGIYTVTCNGKQLGTVARVGGVLWAAYGTDEEIRGARFAFTSRKVAAEKLEAYVSTGNREWIAPAN